MQLKRDAVPPTSRTRRQARFQTVAQEFREHLKTIFTGGGELRNSLEDDQSHVIPLWRATAKVEDIADHGFEDRASALSSVPQ